MKLKTKFWNRAIGSVAVCALMFFLGAQPVAFAGLQNQQDNSAGEIDHLTPANMTAFLKTFSRDASEVNATFEQMSKSQAHMFDEKGKTLGRRRIKDREQTAIDLKKTLNDFKRHPDNLVAAMTLSAQTEELADEIYDLTEIAYDNDQEETALNLTRLLGHFNDDASLIQAYALELAGKKEQRLTQLEKGRQ